MSPELQDAINNVYLYLSESRGTLRGQTLNGLEHFELLKNHKFILEELKKGQAAMKELECLKTTSMEVRG